ncbi:MAG: HNH endonuclease [Gammaproteobacteria bacterium]|nr:HNH endonuclease [Gammaproteobacteria bacterium]MBU1723029.1 HNH endonuclease [Gammaproteobacteria bacterium]MBU2003830.1 HNH endonuclease [Gammaproteobacteria bacterium]
MNAQELLTRIASLNVWKKGDQRAPHKPLLLLLALARINTDQPRLIPFSAIEGKLAKLLEDFGPSRASYYPELPFWHLQSDQIWDFPHTADVLTQSGSVSRKYLRDHQVQAGFTQEVYDLLKATPDLIEQAAMQLLEENFPPSMHQDILDEVGLDFEVIPQYSTQKRARRDPTFRRRVLEAYDYRCAICSFSVRMENTPIALEAAHIKWFQAGGPDIESNGLALCSLHHKLLDRGALAISNEHKIVVSEKANGHGGFQDWVLNFHGKLLLKPRQLAYAPKLEFTDWHIREVFQGKYG